MPQRGQRVHAGALIALKWRHCRRARASAPRPSVTQPTALTYRDAGVDIDAGNALVERIKPLVRR
ncbi:MAG: hypothetical protein ABIP16_05190, partial [Thermomonas sp.]